MVVIDLCTTLIWLSKGKDWMKKVSMVLLFLCTFSFFVFENMYGDQTLFNSYSFLYIHLYQLNLSSPEMKDLHYQPLQE